MGDNGRLGGTLPALLIHRLTLTTAKIRALGAISLKQVQLSTPAGYRHYLVRVLPGGSFAFTDNLGGLASLDVSIDIDGEAISSDFPVAIDAAHATIFTDFAKLAPERWLGRDYGPLASAPTGFTLRSSNTSNNGAGPTFSTLNPEIEGSVTLEIHFLRASIIEVSL